MDIVTKATAEIRPEEDRADAPHGAFKVILSTPTKDRDGEKVATEEWQQPLPDHITFDVDHGMSVASTVGSGKPEIDSQGRLIVPGTYSSRPLAQETRALVNEGHIRTVSVAFMRHTEPVKGGKTRTTRELLNGAFVAVPANPEALILSSKAGARNSKTDQGHIQAAHDSLTMAGATCSTKAAKVAGSEDGDDADPGTLAQALDAAIDEALDSLDGVDLTALPAEVQQAVALLQAADLASDELLDAMGLPDPDEQDSTAQAASATPPKSAAAARAAAADPKDADAAAQLAMRARSLRVIAQTTT